jgi:hypothetical protein
MRRVRALPFKCSAGISDWASRCHDPSDRFQWRRGGQSRPDDHDRTCAAPGDRPARGRLARPPRAAGLDFQRTGLPDAPPRRSLHRTRKGHRFPGNGRGGLQRRTPCRRQDRRCRRRFEVLARCKREVRTALAGNASEIAKLLGVSLAEVAVLGHGGNDVAMFARGGLSIAMGNASPEVQQAADFVTDSNGEEGFANAIERSSSAVSVRTRELILARSGVRA